MPDERLSDANAPGERWPAPAFKRRSGEMLALRCPSQLCGLSQTET
jgi:hypothetical protein